MIKYRYGFNGKENDNEVKGTGNQQDYGMRILDDRIGRFLSVDPLQAKYAELTPYQFGSNSPIANIDLDGLERVHYTLTYQDGKPVLSQIKTEVSGGFLGMVKYDAQAAIHYNDETFYFHSNNREDLKVQNIPEWNYGNYNMNQLGDFLLDPSKFSSEEDNAKLTFINSANAMTSTLAMTSAGSARSRLSAKPSTPEAATNKQVNAANGGESSNKSIVVLHNENEVPIYRGGGDFELKPAEYKVSEKAKFPVRGLTLTVDVEKAKGFGGAYKITSIPEGLQMIPTPSKNDPGHFDIIPKDSKMTQDTYQKLLNQIKTEKVE